MKKKNLKIFLEKLVQITCLRYVTFLSLSFTYSLYNALGRAELLGKCFKFFLFRHLGFSEGSAARYSLIFGWFCRFLWWLWINEKIWGKNPKLFVDPVLPDGFDHRVPGVIHSVRFKAIVPPVFGVSTVGGGPSHVLVALSRLFCYQSLPIVRKECSTGNFL